MTKFKFKSLVNTKLKMRSSEYLTQLQMAHSKSKFLYQEQKMQEYLTTELLSKREKQLLFRLRSRTTPNKTNYKAKYLNNLSCTLCEIPDLEESESHLLCCDYLTSIPELAQELLTIQYEDIYKSLPSQIKAVKVWSKIFKIYESKNETSWKEMLLWQKIWQLDDQVHLPSGASYICFLLIYDIGFLIYTMCC